MRCGLGAPRWCRDKKLVIPMELCTIDVEQMMEKQPMPGQIEKMIKYTTKKPLQRKASREASNTVVEQGCTTPTVADIACLAAAPTPHGLGQTGWAAGSTTVCSCVPLTLGLFRPRSRRSSRSTSSLARTRTSRLSASPATRRCTRSRRGRCPSRRSRWTARTRSRTRGRGTCT